MDELKTNEYYKVLPLIEHVEYHTVFARAVIEQRQSGGIYVDNTVEPTVALISHHCGMSILCGSQKNIDFNVQLRNLLLSKPIDGQKQLRLAVYPESWHEELERLLRSKLVHYEVIAGERNLSLIAKEAKLKLLSEDHVIKWSRVKFEFDRRKFEHRLKRKEEFPDGFVLKRIDAKLLEGITGAIVPQHFWTSEDNFLENGVGFCLLRGDTIVSTAFSAFIGNNAIDIGIETNPAFRGQGHGILTGAAMVEYCLKNGFEPVWGCRKDNLASGRLAQKLGFEEKIVHPSYWSVG